LKTMNQGNELVMRRHDKEITSRQEIDTIIGSALVCRIALADGDEPYVVPVSFGYDGEALFIHTAKSGRKIEFIEANSRVCFELEDNVSLQADDGDACKWTFAFESVIGYGTITELETAEADDGDACKWTFAFESVIGYGTITELETAGERARGLNQIMLHYSGREWEIDEAAIATTRVWRIKIESLTGKRSVEKPAP